MKRKRRRRELRKERETKTREAARSLEDKLRMRTDQVDVIYQQQNVNQNLKQRNRLDKQTAAEIGLETKLACKLTNKRIFLYQFSFSSPYVPLVVTETKKRLCDSRFVVMRCVTTWVCTRQGSTSPGKDGGFPGVPRSWTSWKDFESLAIIHAERFTKKCVGSEVKLIFLSCLSFSLF